MKRRVVHFVAVSWFDSKPWRSAGLFGTGARYHRLILLATCCYHQSHCLRLTHAHRFCPFRMELLSEAVTRRGTAATTIGSLTGRTVHLVSGLSPLTVVSCSVATSSHCQAASSGLLPTGYNVPHPESLSRINYHRLHYHHHHLYQHQNVIILPEHQD